MRKNDERHFEVRLHGRIIGMLHRRDDYTWLTFEPSYLQDPARAVLGLRFEEDLLARHAANLRLPPWFSNLLPEGRLREWISQARGTSVSREMELLAQVGHDLPGAVQVIETDEAVARAPDARREIMAGVPRSAAAALWRFSLAGVGLKFSMLAREDRFTAPGVGEGGDWIIKLPDPTYPAVPLNEFAMMTLARASGIEVPEVKLIDRDQVESLPEEVWHRGERTAYAVQRFDRTADRTPIHIEDLAQFKFRTFDR
jgi:serine/threonine-protein kinase HipA